MDDETKEAWLTLIRAGKGRHAAARQLGVDPRTVRRHLAADASFREAFELADEEAWEPAEDRLLAAAKEGEPWAILKGLGHRHAARWGEQARKVDVAVTGGVKVDVEHGLTEGAAALVRSLGQTLRERQAVIDVDSWEAEPGLGEAEPVGPGDRSEAEPPVALDVGGGPPAGAGPAGAPAGPVPGPA